MIEGEDEKKIHRFAQDLVELVKKHIGKQQQGGPPLLSPKRLRAGRRSRL
jgi:hypothetical protein